MKLKADIICKSSPFKIELKPATQHTSTNYIELLSPYKGKHIDTINIKSGFATNHLLLRSMELRLDSRLNFKHFFLSHSIP